MIPVKFKFYATLLDAFQTYLNSDLIYQKYWGGSETPKWTQEEFADKKFHELLDTINRTPHELNEKAEKGTAFNEVVDCLILGCKSAKMEITSLIKPGFITAKTNGFTFDFPIPLCKEFAGYFAEAIPQVYVSGTIETKYGNVLLYGYVDELLPLSVHDIKTTKQYNAFKFLHNWQHRIYPYCLMQMGNDIRLFEYNVTDFSNTYTETYVYDPEHDPGDIRLFCERFIEFLYLNADQITDKKIFAEDN